MSCETLKKKDFANDVDVRWCPGCGDYAILSAFQKALPEIGLPPEQHVIVSGIGCAGRFPYYMNTYGFHTIHGRANAVATGLKAMRDDLTVWVVTGDGDALSIGTNHFIHSMRRNVNINIILVNNQIYGLTKGQFSPTSPTGQITKTSPHGVNTNPLNPLAMSLAVGATFVARGVDKDPSHLAQLIVEAEQHKGCSLIEVYQDCRIFNKGAFDAFSVKKERAKNTVQLKHGEPMLFGDGGSDCLTLHEGKIMRATENAINHDRFDFEHAMRLARLPGEDYPVPLGVFYQQEAPIFTLPQTVNKKPADLRALYRGQSSWTLP